MGLWNLLNHVVMTVRKFGMRSVCFYISSFVASCRVCGMGWTVNRVCVWGRPLAPGEKVTPLAILLFGQPL